jgi:thiamine-monophosphate kinase
VNEFSFIKEYLVPLTWNRSESLGLTNDAALLSIPTDKQLVCTADTLISNVHFRNNDPPAYIAQKALRVNLSDLAAMGATPYGYMLALSLHETNLNPAWLKAFCEGLSNDQDTYKVFLLGGDTTHHPTTLTITVTMLGTVAKDKAFSRSGARPGDLIVHSGTLGQSAAGLAILNKMNEYSQYIDLVKKYWLPEPRLALSQYLQKYNIVTSAMDISDGLIQDAGHLANNSSQCFIISEQNILIDPQTLTHLSREQSFTYGDDYELLFTIQPQCQDILATIAQATHTPLTVIGYVTEGIGVKLLKADGSLYPLGNKGWTHF